MGVGTLKSGELPSRSSPANVLLTFSRETIKRLLAFPPDTNMVWKSHDDSIAQRSALEQARQDKAGTGGNHERRRGTLYDDSAKEREK